MDWKNFSEEYRQSQEESKPKRTLLGASILDYAEREIDFSVNLLGNRWISRLAGGFIVAPSGHGKSSLVMQMACSWSCGRPCCSIKPAQPLRIFIAQAEDDDNDTIEMAQMLNRMSFSAKELDLVRQNTHIEWLNDCTGRNFFGALNDLLKDWPADLLFINPYTAYQTEDVLDNAANAQFLRVELSRLLNNHHLGVLIVHHTAKTQFRKKDDFAWFDWMYDMAGGAVLTNWARAVLIIAPSLTPGTYKFVAAKRFEKIGWQEREYWFAHSVENNQMLWVPANSDQIASAKKAQALEPQDLLCHIPILEAISQEKFFQAIRGKIGEKKARRFIEILIQDGKVFPRNLPRNGKKSAVGYSQTNQCD
jgi:AAA domain